MQAGGPFQNKPKLLVDQLLAATRFPLATADFSDGQLDFAASLIWPIGWFPGNGKEDLEMRFQFDGVAHVEQSWKSETSTEHFADLPPRLTTVYLVLGSTKGLTTGATVVFILVS